MRNTARFKDEIFDQFARIGKAVASARRLELLDLLCQGEKTVEELAAHSRIDVKSASAHLKVLRSSRLVESRRNGKYVVYRLADQGVVGFWLAMRRLAEDRLAEIGRAVESFFTERDTMSPVDRRTLLARAKRGDVVVLDVRPLDEYDGGHIPHARSLPLAELKRKCSTLPRDKEVIAYCRGPYCVMSLEAVELLRRRGFRATRMDDGVVEWKAAGMPVERSAPR